MRAVLARAMACLAALSLVAGCTGSTAGPSSPSSAPPTAPAGGDGPRPVAVNAVPPAEPTNGAVLPEEFGAAGDGFSDDTAPMQAAVDAAAERGARVVLGEDRTYLLTGSIELPSGTFVTGAGPSSVLQFTWRFNDPEHDGFYLGNRDQKEEGNTDIVLQRFAIRGAAPGTPAGPKELLTLPNVPAIRFRLVDRFRISQLDIGYAPGISIIHQGCSNGSIVSNDIHHSGRDGINSTWHHRNMHDILIADNVITKVGDDAIAVIGAPGEAVNRRALPYRIVVEDNVVRGWPSNVNGLALGRGISVLAASRVRLERNVIMRTHSAGILVSASTRPFSIDPGTGAPWRSSRIQVVDNRIVDAGQNFVGADPDVDTPKHDGIVIKESDHVWLSRNTVIRPYGEEISLLDCHRCTDDIGTKADEKVQP